MNYFVIPGTLRVKIRRKTVKIVPYMIFEVIERITGVSQVQIISFNRRANISSARHLFCYLVRFYCKLPYTEIGALLGDRDHATIINSCHVASDLLCTEKEFKEAFAEATGFIQDTYRNGKVIKNFKLPKTIEPKRIKPNKKRKSRAKAKVKQMEAVKKPVIDIPRIALAEKEHKIIKRAPTVYSNQNWEEKYYN